jgi:uncharacterized protein YndB with AHSA1/START domain
MDTDRVERETLIAASLERVWEVLTHPGSWIGEADPAGFELREGETYVFAMGEVRMHQRAVKIEPMRYISYRWAPYPIFGGGVEPREGNSTLVELMLSQDGDHVRLRVVESGYDSLEAPEELRRKGLEGNARGWDGALVDLKQRAEQAAP